MATKAEQIADRFEEANADFIRSLESLTPEQWTIVCPDYGWTVGVMAHHVAEDHAFLANFVAGMAAGTAPPQVSAEMINTMNAEHAQRAADATKEETIELARAAGAQAVETVRRLADDQLQNTVQFETPGGFQTVTGEWVAENILVGHIRSHLAPIQAAVSQATAGA